MADFIGNATSVQLLCLMSVPLIGVVFLIVFLTLTFRRRRAKTGMKHGIQVKDEASTDSVIDEFSTVSSADPEDEPSSADRVAPEEIPETSPPPAQALDLNFDVLSRVDMDTSGTSTSPEEEKVDLAGRLGTLPPATMPQSVPPSPQSPVTAQPSAAEQPPTATPPEEPVELMRLLRHPRSGQLIVEVAGRRYTMLTDIDDKETGQYVLELAAHLLAFTSGVIATDVGVKSVYLPQVGETPMPIVASTPASRRSEPIDDETPSVPLSSEPVSAEHDVSRPSPEAEAALLASLRAQPSQPEPKSRRGGGLFGRVSKSEGQMLPSFNLADEINQIVQTRLSISPLASTTKVEVLSDHSGGIRINVDGKIYSNPDDILNPEVKTLIKDSIKQWERS